jgi:lysyl-tRNA synthetase class 2
MRISIGELWQKRLMAGGFPKTFEIGRAYRNEGSSPEHMQEFTNMEFYWSYADYNDGMTLVTKMYRKLAMEVFGTTKFSYRDHTFDLADEWVKIDYTAEILKQTGVNIGTASESDIKKRLSELKITYEGNNRERLVDTLWKYCRKNIAGPAFLVNHPKLVAPLAKSVVGGEGGVGGMSGDAGEGGEKGDNGLTEGDGGGENSQTVQMFQPIIGGSEIGRGYSELNDPIDQADRFAKQKKLLEGGDTEAMMVDDEFVEMLEHGMPPTCGFGFGERFFAILCNKPLRETQLFPLMKPRG